MIGRVRAKVKFLKIFNGPLIIGISVGLSIAIAVTTSYLIPESVSALTIRGETVVTHDTDGDGIADEVDTLPSTFSNDFSDVGLGGATTGTITNRGAQILTVREEPAPAGVRVSADPSGGASEGTISACGDAALLSLNAGDELVLTCGSVTIQVINGTVEVSFVAVDGTTGTTSISEGNSVTFEPTTFTFTAPSTNSDVVVIIVEGEEFSIDPGGTVQVPFLITIDIKPSSDFNSVLCSSSRGTIAVGIFSKDGFDANEVDVSTLKLEGIPVREIHNRLHPQDLDGAGELDTVVHLSKVDVCQATSNLPLRQSISVTLTGTTSVGQNFEGSDTIRIVRR